MSNLILAGKIESKIYLIRGQKVMLDFDLAELYEVPTKRINEQVKRNIERFPADFMFQLTKEEFDNLRSHLRILNLKSQNATSSWGGLRKMPRVFTEQGVAMLSTVLKSKRAIRVNIVIMRTFVKIRQILSTNKEILQKLDQLERRVGQHDVEIKGVFQAIRELMRPKEEKNKKIGFLK